MANLWGSALSSGEPGGSKNKGLGLFNASGLASGYGANPDRMPTTVHPGIALAPPSGGGGTSQYAKTDPGVGSAAGAYGTGGTYGSGGGFGLASSGGGGGGGAGTGGGVPITDMGSPFTGFAARYMPGSAEMLFSNPEVILRDTLRDMGRLPDQGLYYMLEPQAAAANALFALGYGRTSDLGAGSNEAGINFINDFLRNQATVGGNAVNFNQALNALHNYEGGSALDSMLNLANPEDQISNYRGIASALANTSLHPLMARAFNSFLDARGTDYMSSVARGDAQSNFGNYLASRQGPMQVL